MQKQTWSVGFLCYNEAGTIKEVVQKALRNLEQIALDFEVIVVDDGSKDGSTEIIKELARIHSKVVPVIHEKNKGIGLSISSFHEHVRFENVFLTAGDGQFDVDEILPFGYVAANHFISFYRKENTVYSLFRNWLSWVNKKMNERLLGINIRDVNWSKIIKRENLMQLDLQLKSSLVETEICSKLLYLGVKVQEVESKYLPRTYGESKGSNWKTVRKAMSDITVLIRVMRKFRKNHKRGMSSPS
jgi:glycosyltransferase involved in cell wall biosynthesis